MLTALARWWLGESKPQVTPAIPVAPRQSAFTTHMELDPFLTKDERLANMAARALPVPKTPVVAMDTAGNYAQDEGYESGLKAAYRLGQVTIPEAQALWYGSQSFIGHQMCALLAQHWLVSKACWMPARDAVRKGYKITVNDGTAVDPNVMEAIAAANKRYGLDRNLTQYIKMGRVFGIRIALCVVESQDPEYYVKPFNPDGITPGSYRGISQVDPYWTGPELNTMAASNPTAIDFYEPTYWIINGQRYHKSHLIIMRGPDVADILKPSYQYGGLSVPQLIYERVYNSERTANEAPQLALTKRADVFYTDIANALANQEVFEQRMTTWRGYLDNYGIKIADKESDKMERHDTSLSDLDAVIMTQYQLVAAAANVPATKLLGTTPKGFNSSGDYETESYHEELESIQVNDLEPLVDRHMLCVIRSDIAPRFGVKPFGVECTWSPLSTMTDVDQAAVNKSKAETDKLYVDMGAIDGSEVRNRVAGDEHSGHSGLPTLKSEDPGDVNEEDPAIQ